MQIILIYLNCILITLYLSSIIYYYSYFQTDIFFFISPICLFLFKKNSSLCFYLSLSHSSLSLFVHSLSQHTLELLSFNRIQIEHFSTTLSGEHSLTYSIRRSKTVRQLSTLTGLYSAKQEIYKSMIILIIWIRLKWNKRKYPMSKVRLVINVFSTSIKMHKIKFGC